MRPRLLFIGVIAVIEVLCLLGIAISATEAPDYQAYVVQQGQTLASIATENGISVEVLAQSNNLKVTDALTAGQVLVVPIVTQLPQTITATAQPVTAPTPAGNQVEGVLGTISSQRAEIRSKPGGGNVLYRKAIRGMQLLVIGQRNGAYAVLMADGSIGWIAQAAVTLSQNRMFVDRPAPKQAAPASIRQGLIDTAFTYLGIPYKYGGRLPDNIDCSLLVQTVFGRHGMRLPRTAAQQYEVGDPVDVSQLQPGDRLYFYKKGTEYIGHTAIYIGDGRFVHASSNRGMVAIDELSNITYWRIFAGARR